MMLGGFVPRSSSEMQQRQSFGSGSRPSGSPRGVDVDFPTSGLSPTSRHSTGRLSSFGGSPALQAVQPSLNAFMMPADTGAFPGRRPILFNVADVFGTGARGERVALGHSSLVMLDPVESDRIGDYEIQIFASRDNAAHTADAPAAQLSISPWSRIASPAPGVVQIAAHGAKDGPHSYTIRFDTEVDAEAFMRDFQVRCRVMKLSLRTARQNTGGRGRRQSDSPRSGGCSLFCYQLKCFAFCTVVGIIGVFAAHSCIIAKANPMQEPLEIVAVALGDMQTAASYVQDKAFEVGEHVGTLGAAACRSIGERCGGSVSTSQLEQCLALTDSVAKIECVETLAAYEPTMSDSWQSMFGDIGYASVPFSSNSGLPSDVKVDGGGIGVENTISDEGLAEAVSATSWEEPS